MRRAQAWRIVAVVAGATALGTFYSVLRGNSSGLGDLLSNVSAPWLALPLLAGWFAFRERPLRGALIGVVVTCAALAAFNLTGSFVFGLGPHRTIAETLKTLVENSTLLRAGVVSGAAFGALGSWLGRWRSTVVVGACAGLFMLEPLASAAAAAWRGVPIGVDTRYYPIWGVEAAAGLAVAAVLWRRRRRTST